MCVCVILTRRNESEGETYDKARESVPRVGRRNTNILGHNETLKYYHYMCEGVDISEVKTYHVISFRRQCQPQ